MRKYLGMEREGSMEAVCDRSYDISCHVQWNVHGADTSSMRTWNHMLLAANAGSSETRATGRALPCTSGILTKLGAPRYARELGTNASELRADGHHFNN
jgi:hypothetical protein